MNFPKWINKAIELREKGLSYNNIAIELKVCKRSVSYYLKEKGYAPNERYVRLNQKQPNKKFVDENVFSVIDTEEKAYWLGIMYADGYVGASQDTIELSLKESDLCHIERFKAFLKSEHKIQRKVKVIKDKEYIAYRLRIIRKKLKDDLIDKGCFNAKTFIVKFPNSNQVPKDLIRHFLRGYMDGDGCITKSTSSIVRVELLGTYDFLHGVSLFFDYKGRYVYSFKGSFALSNPKNKSDTDIKRLVLGGQNAIDFLNYIYKDSTIHLQRKYLKYIEFASLYKEYINVREQNR